MPHTLNLLLAEHCGLTAALQHARADARRAAKLCTITSRSRCRAWNLQNRQRNVVLIIYTLCQFDKLPAVVYLRRLGARRRWAPLSDSDLTRFIEDMFLSAELADMVGLASIDAPTDPVAMHIAMQTVREWRVVQWGIEMNCRGVAPSTSDLLFQAQGMLPSSAQTRTQTGRPTRSARMWASRRVHVHAHKLNMHLSMQVSCAVAQSHRSRTSR